ncbi:MAG: serine/threonine protein kinase, partial [Xanthomonadales bacterium]|nr:serine/threonine protein kinase [Xanthomonadales bacterium]
MSQDLPTEVLGEASPGSSDDLHTLAPGQPFGPYTIEQAIGRGGMGEVYRARQQTPVNRVVALKLLQQRLRGTLAETLFQVESQALARLRHPFIAQVYDAGSLEGQPYLAMEWVEGLPMSEWISRRRPNRRQRLALVAEVARGAHHAHANGILHRDLKPDNVMVVSEQGREQPKIIDFGVAVAWLAERHDEGTPPRSLVERVGTPTYMSPEQRGGRADLDPRSDVYSLGVMLLQMLLGDELEPWPTLDSQRCAALLRQGSWTQPEDPEGLQLQLRLRSLPDELRWLLARALAEDRQARYESALNLALDLERFLDQRPLEAAPESRLYPLRKFLQRNRLPAALAGLTILALVGGLAVALYGLRQAQTERANAIAAAEQARVEAARAERVSDFVRSILGAVDPDVARELDKTLLRKVLDEAAERARTELADDPAVLGSIEAVIGRTYRNLGEPARALPLLERARDQGELRSVVDMRILSMAYDDLGRTDEAMATLDGFRAQLVPEQGEQGIDVLQLDAERLEYL